MPKKIEKEAAQVDEAQVPETPEAEAPEVEEINEEEIRAKVMSGLTRDQAIEVITNQREHDKSLASQ